MIAALSRLNIPMPSIIALNRTFELSGTARHCSTASVFENIFQPCTSPPSLDFHGTAWT